MSDPSITKRERQRQRRLDKEQSIIEDRARRKRKRQAYIYGVLAVILIGVGIIIWVSQMGDDGEEATTTTTGPTETTSTQITFEEDTSTTRGEQMPNYTPYTAEQYGQGECPPDQVPDEPVLSFSDTPQLCIDLTKQYDAIITTSEGVVRVRLDVENTPGTANNFVTLSRYGYYNGSLLFRTDTSIDIIQGGGPHNNSPSDPGPGYTILDEGTEFAYEAGDLVMARTQAPNSSGSQFFFAAGANTSLLDSQGVYVTFGKTIEGLDVLENILGLHQDDPTSGLGGGPSREIVVESVEIVEAS